jgi:hypothetical protein
MGKTPGGRNNLLGLRALADIFFCMDYLLPFYFFVIVTPLFVGVSTISSFH